MLVLSIRLREIRFTDIQKESLYYCDHLDLEKETLGSIENIIKENSTRVENGFIFRGIYRDSLITF